MLIGCVTPSSEFLIRVAFWRAESDRGPEECVEVPSEVLRELDLLRTEETSAARRAESVQIAGIDGGCPSRQSLHLRKLATEIPASISLQLSLMSRTGIYFVGDGTNV